MLAQPATPAEAVRAVDDDIAHGADVIKLFVVSWVGRAGKHVPVPMSLAIVEAQPARLTARENSCSPILPQSRAWSLFFAAT